jgi:hypothetical protein
MKGLQQGGFANLATVGLFIDLISSCFLFWFRFDVAVHYANITLPRVLLLRAVDDIDDCATVSKTVLSRAVVV